MFNNLKTAKMIVYAINTEIENIDKTKQIICSVEIKGEGYNTWRKCIKILDKKDVYNRVTQYVSKRYFNEIINN